MATLVFHTDLHIKHDSVINYHLSACGWSRQLGLVLLYDMFMESRPWVLHVAPTSLNYWSCMPKGNDCWGVCCKIRHPQADLLVLHLKTFPACQLLLRACWSILSCRRSCLSRCRCSPVPLCHAFATHFAFVITLPDISGPSFLHERFVGLASVSASFCCMYGIIGLPCRAHVCEGACYRLQQTDHHGYQNVRLYSVKCEVRE